MSTQSLVVFSRSFAKVFYHAQILEDMHCETQTTMISVWDTRETLVGSLVAHSL